MGLCGHVRRLRADERGIALISAVGMLAVLSGVGVSLIAYSTSNYRAAEFSSSAGVAGHAAEAGLNEAISVLANAPDATRPEALPPGTATIDGETVSWSGVLEGDVWTITSVSTVTNPTGAGEIRRTVTGNVRVVVDAGPSGIGAWNYVFADDLTTCTTLGNNVTVRAPLFVTGNLCLDNVATVAGPTVSVGGTISVNNPGASVGTPQARLAEVHVGGGCRVGKGRFVSPCGDAQRVYALPPGADTAVQQVTKPPVDVPKWYAASRPGPLSNCTRGSFPGGFDTDRVMNRSLPAPVNLMPAAPYDCVVTSGPHTLGRIAWTGGSTGTLTVMGTIFFDGDIVLSNNAAGVYSGRGVIYASGRVEISNWTSLCGAPACAEAGWDPNRNLVVFVAGAPNDPLGLYMNNNAKFQGAVYAAGDVRQENSAILQGPVIARQLYLFNSASTAKWAPIGALLPGTPAPSAETTVSLVPQSWGG